MAKIARVRQKLFGSGGPSSDFGKFGSLAAGSPIFTKDPATIQSLNAFLSGWAAAVINDDRPALEDANSLELLTFYQLAYLFQAGIPEWDTDTPYYIGSFVQVAGVVYKSKTDNNTSNDPTSSPTNWSAFLNIDPLFLADQVTDPATTTTQLAVYAKAVSSVLELFTRKSNNGTAIRLSRGGMLNGGIQQEIETILNTVVNVNNVPIPVDTSIPQNNEGVELMTVTISPKDVNSILTVEWGYWGSINFMNQCVTALFRDTNTDAIAAWLGGQAASGAGGQWSQKFRFGAAGTTNPITFKLRVGGQGQFYVNGTDSGGQAFGGVAYSYLRVIEYTPAYQ